MMNFHPIKTGLFISMLVVLYGFSLGIVFGGYEDDIKENYSKKADSVLETVYQNDVAKKEKHVDKAWEFLKLAHTHALGLGPIALVLIVLLGLIHAGELIKIITSVGIGIGSLGYPVYWTIASLQTPTAANYHQVKESLWWVAQPAAGLCFLGLLVIMFLFVKNHLLVCPRKEK